MRKTSRVASHHVKTALHTEFSACQMMFDSSQTDLSVSSVNHPQRRELSSSAACCVKQNSKRAVAQLRSRY